MKLYYPSINLLRGVAALLVCIYHFTNQNINGTSFLGEGDLIAEVGKLGIHGVFIFFVISGFVIPISMHNGKYKIGRLHRFLARRWVRIEIPYFISIIGILGFHYISCYMYYWPFKVDKMQLLHHLTYTIPFTDYSWYNVIFWTLAIEFQFYIAIALIYPLMTSENRYVKLITLVAFGCSGLLVDHHGILLYYGPIFALGMTLFLRNTDRISLKEFWVLFLIFTVSMFAVHDIGVGVSALLTVMFIAFTNIDNKYFNWLGDISYSLYLIHGIIGGNLMYWVGRSIEDYWLKVLFIVGVLIASILSAYLFWLLFERPSQRLSKRVKL